MGFTLNRGCCRFLSRLVQIGLAVFAAAILVLRPLPVQAGLFDDFSIHDEAELGRKFNLMVRSRLPIIEDPEIKQYVRMVVDRLAKAIPPQPFPFKTDVILHPSMNAFAVPGGYVFAHTGLIIQLEHESELAAVIAHELAHVTQRHVANRIDRSKYTSLASLVGALAGAFLGGKGNADVGGALLAGSMAAGQSAMLSYSRLDETEADQIGLQYLIKAGYAPRGMVGAFEKIRKRQWSSGIVVPEYLSTHPDIGNRVNDISTRISLLSSSIRNRPEDDSRFLRVRTLLMARYANVDVALRQFVAAGENNGLALMGRGMLAARTNRVKEAEELFNRAIAASPNDALIRREAGAFHYNVGSGKAEALLTQALRLDPKDSMTQYWHARLLDDSGRRSEAQQYFRQLLKNYPDDAEIHQYLGVSLGKSQQLCEGWLHLAYSALYQNDMGKAMRWFGKAKAEAKTPEQKRLLSKFEETLKARREYLKND